MAVTQTAFVEGVSTQKADQLVPSLGLEGIDKGRASPTCRKLDEDVQCLSQRALDTAIPYVWWDALYLKVRQNHHIANMALVISDARQGVLVGAAWHRCWQVERRYFSQQSMRNLKAPEEEALGHVPALRLAPIH